MSPPFTLTLDIMGKVTLYLVEQKVLISALVPGSCEPKLLAGMPTMTKLRLLYFSYTLSRAEYCGVKPQRLATLTRRTTLPLRLERGVALPSIEFMVKS